MTDDRKQITDNKKDSNIKLFKQLTRNPKRETRNK